ncbi:hypothetical protein [Cupriavidus consociatus]|uniref:hypothetical protein n=1 Tax=Cupriavidus consociatus TaxID=2821357 RepID=UPI001AEAE19A|nr:MULTISPECIES: hypothetical protein [unclassified Cupriavidus]MBP0625257.1 hypothetical protein [Cupriavidus sp. LEh25]MDK2661991.1 hypothetical protein [Cupriavidus sp. LEh21]
MNIFTGIESTELFGGTGSPAVEDILTSVRGGSNDQVGAALWTAVLTHPQCLPPYYLLYRFHANRGELRDAKGVALRALSAAALQASIDTDWRLVQPNDTDFTIPGPARFWLITLKALAFINARLGDEAAARKLITKLHKLDPTDCIGLDVVNTLLQSNARTDDIFP